LPFTVYIDDSGTGGALWDWHGQAVDFSASLPILTVAAVAVHDNIAVALENDWRALRTDIARVLSLDELPPIHMRLMYGHELPRKHHGAQNPYLSAMPDQRLSWIESAIEIIDKYKGQNQLFAFGQVVDKKQYFLSLNSYYESPNFLREYEFLRTLPLGVKPLRAYHNVAANPHARMLSELLFFIQKGIKKQSDKKCSLIYDCNPASKGFDIMKALRIIQRSGHLTCISSLAEGNEVDFPLIQIADVCSYRFFRDHLFRYRKAAGGSSKYKNDPIMESWAQKYPVPVMATPPLTRQDYVHVITIHYEIAKAAMETISPHGKRIADTHLVSIQEFLDRCHQTLRAARDGGDGSGIPILKNS
jgi:hypothetical protein